MQPTIAHDRPPLRVAALYIAFAVIAVGSNLGSQWLTARVLGSHSFFVIELIVGTGVGVVVKFLLDRAFIFDGSAQKKPVAEQAGLYLATSVLTTIIFWGGEGLCVWWFGKTDLRFVVGAATLAIGYLIKYQLDKRITFA